VWVHAHLRGGGEFGEQWWRDGRLGHKQHTFDDLFAVAEDLVRRGVTTPTQLGMTGSSNGGLLAGAAIAQRPELFRAVVPQVPLLDALGCRRDPHSVAIAIADYGNPDDPEHATWLLSWSPYQNLRDGVAYPAVLLDAGENDTACPPWHSRKFAARLREQSNSGRPVLLRVRAESGHSTMTEAQMAERDAEELAFLADELGLRP
jgi:prolyl oligopeptidase